MDLDGVSGEFKAGDNIAKPLMKNTLLQKNVISWRRYHSFGIWGYEYGKAKALTKYSEM